MSRRRKAGRPKSRPPRRKKSDRKRTCPSGKIGWSHQGEADAALRKRQPHTSFSLETYECPECGLWHFANSISRSARRRMAKEGKPIPPPREDS